MSIISYHKKKKERIYSAFILATTLKAKEIRRILALYRSSSYSMPVARRTMPKDNKGRTVRCSTSRLLGWRENMYVQLVHALCDAWRRPSSDSSFCLNYFAGTYAIPFTDHLLNLFGEFCTCLSLLSGTWRLTCSSSICVKSVHISLTAFPVQRSSRTHTQKIAKFPSNLISVCTDGKYRLRCPYRVFGRPFIKLFALSVLSCLICPV